MVQQNFIQSQTVSPSVYAAEYLALALSSQQLSAPDISTANGTGELLISLHAAHAAGGPEAVRRAWENTKRLRPELIYLETHVGMLIHASMLKTLSKPQLQIEDYPFYKFGFNILVGSSGSGKSFVALDFGCKVAQTESVIYIVGEGLNGYAPRYEAWKDFNQKPDGNLYFHKEPVQIHHDDARQQFIDLVRPKNPALIIVDTLARCAVDLEENSARDMGKWVEACDIMRRDLNCGVLIVHHTGKDKSSMRGSSALYGAADSVVMQNKEDGRIALINDSDGGGKNKYSEEVKRRYFRIKPHTVGEHAGAVIVEAEAVIDEPSRDFLSFAQRRILETIDGHEKGLTPKQVTDATTLGSSTVFRQLAKLLKQKFLEQDDSGKYIITEAGEEALQS